MPEWKIETGQLVIDEWPVILSGHLI